MAHPIRPDSYMEINNFYTVTVYEKGAEVVRMQANLLGPETYRKATDLYFERHDGQAVTTEDFVQCMADASGRDLTQFKRWYDQAGTPEIRVTGRYDESAQSYHLDFEQSCPTTPGQSGKQPFHIPLAIALLDVWGKALPLQLADESEAGPSQRVLELREEKQRFTFIGIESEPVPSLLRGFSAPVKLQFDYSDKDLMFLMAKDSDDFNRWDAAHTLSQRTLLKLIDDIQQDRPLNLDEGYIDAFSKALNDQEADKALLTEVLSLPSESTIGDQMAVVDVDAIHQAREWLKHELASRLRQVLVETYSINCIGGDYDVEHSSMARRSLKNLALHLLMQLEEPDIYELCMNQYQTANNMTDVMAALSALSNSQAPQRVQALTDFESKWQDDPLVMDKWFSVQAMAKLPGTLRQVKSLMDHPAFSIRNPNKVRSLVGAFCSGNLVNFHAADGSGYTFLIDNVLTLDGLNPQVAARMLRIMSRWRRYDESRQALMKAQFERVLAKSDVSKDVFEIASKSLAEVDG
jgi:aminopeptidase N